MVGRVRSGLMAVVAMAVCGAFAVPTVVETIFPTDDLVIAEAVFAAEGLAPDAVTDALQRTLDAVRQRGGGTVFLPAGAYAVTKPVVVPDGVTLRGDYNPQRPASGTVLAVTAGRDAPDGPAAVTLGQGAGVVGLVFWYPEQRLDAPAAYPWTVASRQPHGGNNQTVADCTLVNPWKGIAIGPGNNECHTFRRVRIGALHTGFYVDFTTDIGRVSDVTISPAVWSESGFANAPDEAALRAWLLAWDSVGADCGRSDWEYISDLVVSGYRTGIRFRPGDRGLANAVMADSCIADCGVALELVGLNQVGLACYGCDFAGRDAAVACDPKFNAIAQFNRCVFRAPLKLTSPGVFSFMDSVGAGDGRATVAPGARVMALRTAIAGITNDAADAAAGAAPARICPSRCAPGRPASRAFVNAADHGVSPEARDNTAALQRALDAAAATGGTVYLPPGHYGFDGSVRVPSGVELRGCSDVPHHTVSGGSVLLARGGRGDEAGRPFVELAPGAGLRGLCFWYPEQRVRAPAAYPWTVRALGRDCWLTDVNIGNAWQGVDFMTHPSAGHRINYVSGAMFRRGVFVGNADGAGWVEDLMFNPHYMLRRPHRLPFVREHGDVGDALADFQRANLEGIVFKDCVDEHIRGTFLFAAKDGIKFQGGGRYETLIHGTDAGSRCVTSELAEGASARIALGQYVSFGRCAEAAALCDASDRGVTTLVASQFWASAAPTAVNRGKGRLELTQFNTHLRAVEMRDGETDAQLGLFQIGPDPQFRRASGKGKPLACVNRRGSLKIEGETK